MNAGQDKFPGKTPAEVYSHRLQELNQVQSAEAQREKRLGFVKLAVAAATLICGVLLLRRPAMIEFVLVPVALFIVLAVLQEKMIRSLRLRARVIDFYQRGTARIEDRWAGTGETGERFLDPSHPYARDLDLFGRASIFELLCTARTRAGEETLAAWLLTAAPVDEILLRQGAVLDLKPRVSFRERLSSLGETVRLGVQPELLAKWGERKPLFMAQATRLATTALAVLWIASLICWGLWGWSMVAAAMTILNLAWAHRLYARLEEAANAVQKATEDLQLLSGVLFLLEQEHFSSPRLLAMQAILQRDGMAPSAAIRKLARIVDYLSQRDNMIARAFDLVLFWSAQLVFVAERWQREFGPAIRGWLQAAGQLEALTALAGEMPAGLPR